MTLYEKERWETNFEDQEEAYWRRTYRANRRNRNPILGVRMLSFTIPK
jgi:hypothetical protein